MSMGMQLLNALGSLMAHNVPVDPSPSSDVTLDGAGRCLYEWVNKNVFMVEGCSPPINLGLLYVFL